MQAETINCPMCGAATSTDSPQCAFCEARLATIACPQCFAMMFIGTKHCPHCGATATAGTELSAEGKNCPRCKSALSLILLGESQMLECSHCLGLWLDPATFEKICANREQQSVVLGAASLHSSRHSPVTPKVSYVPCPDCHELMNRANFARCSGVIVDLCKQHGIWFDRDELSKIIEFIRNGGMQLSRSKEKAQLDEERRRIQQEQLALEHQRSTLIGKYESENRLTGIASAGGLLKLLLG
jgi:Zn-finger nucleic acid-binding protein